MRTTPIDSGTFDHESDQLRLRVRLYILGDTSFSRKVVETVRDLCEEFLGNGYLLEIVDLEADPARAGQDGIIAVPTLLRLQPEPEKRIIGDMTERELIVKGLGLRQL